VRDGPPRDRTARVDVIHRYANMVSDLGDEIAETDAKPVPVHGEGKSCRAVDSRVILKKK
jgi:hypothetical protein